MKMEQKTNDEFMRNILVEEAWKDLSLGFAWSEPLLEKYQDRVSWEDISLNPYIRWTIPMVGKFSKRINWKIFSACGTEEVLTPELVEAFKDKWDWHELSGNPELHLSYEQMEKFADLLDWVELITSETLVFPMGKASISTRSFASTSLPANCKGRLCGVRCWSSKGRSSSAKLSHSA